MFLLLFGELRLWVLLLRILLRGLVVTHPVALFFSHVAGVERRGLAPPGEVLSTYYAGSCCGYALAYPLPSACTLNKWDPACRLASPVSPFVTSTLRVREAPPLGTL
jgi:hypothetical protein